MKKIVSCILVIVCIMFLFTACDSPSGSTVDKTNTKEIANKLQTNQPTPTDIDYSLERYNLIRRAYWVNGQREKAASVPCSVEKPLGYIVLFTESGAVVGKFVVDGKVSSLNSYLTPDSEYYEISSGSTYKNEWLTDVDGSYGENDSGIFFFDTMGNYIEWTGTYLYTDIPMTIENPVINFDVTYEED